METPPLTPPSNGNSDPDSLPLKDQLDYAWKWFQYHAGQRLIAFNFLLILMGALSVGYYKAYDAGRHGHAAIIAAFGVIVALAFFILELRNEDLVNIGREALKSLERLPAFSSPPECRLVTIDRDRSRLKSHAFWLRTIELFLLAIFLGALILSLSKTICVQS